MRPQVAISGFTPQAELTGVLLPAIAASDGSIRVFVVVRNAVGAATKSPSVKVAMKWDAAALADPSAQAALVSTLTAAAQEKVWPRVSPCRSLERHRSTASFLCEVCDLAVVSVARDDTRQASIAVRTRLSRRFLSPSAPHQLYQSLPEATVSLVAGLAAFLNAASSLSGAPGADPLANPREALLELLAEVSDALIPSASVVEALSVAVSEVCSSPTELTEAAQGAALRTLGAVAGAGAMLSGTAAVSAAKGLSAVATAAAMAPAGQRRMLVVQHRVRRTALASAADSAHEHHSPPPALPPLPSLGVLTAVMGVLDKLHNSLSAAFSVPGEEPVVLSTDAVHMVSQLDSLAQDSRLFHEAGLRGAGSAFEPLPAGLFARTLPGGAAAVRTQFLALKFKCAQRQAPAYSGARLGAPPVGSTAASSPMRSPKTPCALLTKPPHRSKLPAARGSTPQTTAQARGSTRSYSRPP